MLEFEPFAKIARLHRPCVVTEKIDGTNAQIIIDEDGDISAGSRTRLITPEDDNFGFAAWVRDNKDDLLKLGPGRHYGEWWGRKIQRSYGLLTRRFSLFNSHRWSNKDVRPVCCDVVPVLYDGDFDTQRIQEAVNSLAEYGSVAAPGFKDPEGVVIYHVHGNLYFKQTINNDAAPKGHGGA